MPPGAAAPNDGPLDTLHAIKNEAARAVGKRMLLESNAAELASRIATHEANVARRLDLDLRGATAYGRDERLADQAAHGKLLAEREHIGKAIADMDARREDLSHQADEALAQRYTGELADLSARLGERIHRFLSLWKQVLLVMKDIETLRVRHHEVQRSLKALRRKQGQPNPIPPEARIPRSLEEVHRVLAELPAPAGPPHHAEKWEKQNVS